MKHVVYLLIVLITWSHDTKAQVFSRKISKDQEVAPKAILVQLPTHQRKINALSKSQRDAKRLKAIQEDRDSIIAKIVADFTDNFNFCPVYYFADTNSNLVKEKKWNDVILNSSLQPLQNFVPTDEYTVLIYSRDVAFNGDEDDVPVVNNSSKRRWIAFDENLVPLKTPLPTGSNSTRLVKPKNAERYTYISKIFDIYYRPAAGNYNMKLHTFYGHK
jgi:hypothetical protein